MSMAANERANLNKAPVLLLLKRHGVNVYVECLCQSFDEALQHWSIHYVLIMKRSQVFAFLGCRRAWFRASRIEANLAICLPSGVLRRI